MLAFQEELRYKEFVKCVGLQVCIQINLILNVTMSLNMLAVVYLHYAWLNVALLTL
jgi:hypothetical protein